MKRHASESRTLLAMAVERGLVDTAAAARAARDIDAHGSGDRLVQLGLLGAERLAELREAFQRELRTRSSFPRDDPAGPVPTIPAAPPQQRIGRYRLLGELGRGAMGVVHRAIDERRAIEVALKLLPADVAEDALRRRRLLEEARKAAMLQDCPHVVTVFEAGVADERAFLAMELVEGQTFEQWLASPHAKDATSDLLRQLIDGVAAAHSVGLVHRDIKPSNLMVTPAGMLKILDFGLAKDVIAPPSADSIDAVVGTPVYMAPELLQMALGLLPIDRAAANSARVDVYAIGVTACEAFAPTGLFPPLRSYGELLERKLAVSAIVQRALGKRPMWPWGHAVPLMLAPDPHARPADAVALLSLLRTAGETAVPGTRGRRLAAVTMFAIAAALGASELLRDARIGWPVGVLMVLLVAGAVVVLRPRRRRRPQPAALQPGRPMPLPGTSRVPPRAGSVSDAPTTKNQKKASPAVDLFELEGTDLLTNMEAARRPGRPPASSDRTAPPQGDDVDLSISLPMRRLPRLEFLEEYWIGPFCLKVCVGDLTRLGAEGWVSTDDARLTMGGGVSATIAMRLGNAHRRAAMAHAPAPVGRVVVTEADLPPVRCVLHAITMGVDAAGHAVPPTLAMLASCVADVFQHARRLRLRSLAIPSLGCGAGGLPPVEVAKIICGQAIAQLADKTNSLLQTIVFVTGSASDPLLAAIRSVVIETGPRELTVRRGSGPATAGDLVPVD